MGFRQHDLSRPRYSPLRGFFHSNHISCTSRHPVSRASVLCALKVSGIRQFPLRPAIVQRTSGIDNLLGTCLNKTCPSSNQGFSYTVCNWVLPVIGLGCDTLPNTMMSKILACALWLGYGTPEYRKICTGHILAYQNTLFDNPMNKNSA